MLTDRFDEALVYASRIHRSQRRKGANTPYVAHLLAVSSLTIEHGGDEDQAIAALLHDAAEDQGGDERLQDIDRLFGGRVARMVADCSDSFVEPKPPWRPRKEAYVQGLAAKPLDSLFVSLADKTHNAEAIFHDFRAVGPAIFDRFTGERAGTLWYYKELSDTFLDLLPGPLAARLALTVDALHAIDSPRFA